MRASHIFEHHTIAALAALAGGPPAAPQAAAAAVATAGAFPAARLNQKDLDKFLGRLTARGPQPNEERRRPLRAVADAAGHAVPCAAEPTASERDYLIQIACRLRGPLDVAAFARAWRQMLDRHAVLRTSFHWTGIDKPLQVVHRQTRAAVCARGLERPAGGRAARRGLRFFPSASSAASTLSEAPLMRVALVRLGRRRTSVPLDVPSHRSRRVVRIAAAETRSSRATARCERARQVELAAPRARTATTSSGCSSRTSARPRRTGAGARRAQAPTAARRRPSGPAPRRRPPATPS